MHRLKFLSYNIDGLSEDSLPARLQVLLALILSENADVVHLQEVVPSASESLTRTLFDNGYICSDSVFAQREYLGKYFALSFVKKKVGETVVFRRVAYSESALSQQGRDMLFTTISLSPIPTPSRSHNMEENGNNGTDRETAREIVTINTHAESCGTAFKSRESTTRIAQLSMCLQELVERERKNAVIFAGDLNVRENEARYLLGRESNAGVVDVAAKIQGKTPQPTWRLPESCAAEENNGREREKSKRAVSCRFDRIYVNSGWRAVSYKLVGEEALFKGLGFAYDTPSDHFGVVCELDLADDFATQDSLRPNDKEQEQKSVGKKRERIETDEKKKDNDRNHNIAPHPPSRKRAKPQQGHHAESEIIDLT